MKSLHFQIVVASLLGVALAGSLEGSGGADGWKTPTAEAAGSWKAAEGDETVASSGWKQNDRLKVWKQTRGWQLKDGWKQPEWPKVAAEEDQGGDAPIQKKHIYVIKTVGSAGSPGSHGDPLSSGTGGSPIDVPKAGDVGDVSQSAGWQAGGPVISSGWEAASRLIEQPDWRGAGGSGSAQSSRKTTGVTNKYIYIIKTIPSDGHGGPPKPQVGVADWQPSGPKVDAVWQPAQWKSPAPPEKVDAGWQAFSAGLLGGWRPQGAAAGVGTRWQPAGDSIRSDVSKTKAHIIILETVGAPVDGGIGWQTAEPAAAWKPSEAPSGWKSTQAASGLKPPSEPVTGWKPSEPATGWKPAEPATGWKPAEPATDWKPPQATTGWKPAEPVARWKPSEPVAGWKPSGNKESSDAWW